jgi:hypothetical protein
MCGLWSLSDREISSFTAGVAVAVSAMNGTCSIFMEAQQHEITTENTNGQATATATETATATATATATKIQ